MKKSVIIKMVTIIITACILINYIPTLSKASWIQDTFDKAKQFTSEDSEDVEVTLDSTKIEDLSDSIYGILLTISILLATIIILVLGIQFMTGSIEQKAKVKEMLIPYAVGCVVVFGSFGIWKLVITIASTVIE